MARTAAGTRTAAGSRGPVLARAGATLRTSAAFWGLVAAPQTWDTAAPDMTGWRTITVKASGGDYMPSQFQDALNDAATDRASQSRPQRVVLDAGLAVEGNWTLPGGPSHGHTIAVMSAGALPAPGTRVTPAAAAQLAVVRTPNTGAALTTANGAERYRLVGLEITHTSGAVPANTSGGQNTVFHLCDWGSGATTVADLPLHITLDRCYLHGLYRRNLTRAVSQHARFGALVDCWVDEVHYRDNDSQAVCGWNGPGPYQLLNCRLEAAGENVMWGGADPNIAGMVPADIEIRRCHLTKDTTWFGNSFNPNGDYDGIPYPIKNLFEIKMARRVWMSACVLEYNIAGQGQNGYGVLLRGGNDSGNLDAAMCDDVLIERCLFRHSAAGFNLVGPEDSAGCHRVLLRHLLLHDIDSRWGGTEAKFLQVLHGPEDVQIDHCSVIEQRYIGYFGENPALKAERFTVTNSILRVGTDPGGARGLLGSGTAQGTETLDAWTTDYAWAANGLIGDGGTYVAAYPADTVWVANDAAALFVNAAAANYRLQSGSPFRVHGTDGTPLGCDIDALEAALEGVE